MHLHERTEVFQLRVRFVFFRLQVGVEPGTRLTGAALRARARQVDSAFTHERRAQVHEQTEPAPGRTAEGATTWFAWSFYLPETLPEGSDQAIGYWESNNSYQQMMAFNTNGDDIRFLDHLASKVKDGDEVSIVPAIAGGV